MILILVPELGTRILSLFPKFYDLIDINHYGLRKTVDFIFRIVNLWLDAGISMKNV